MKMSSEALTVLEFCPEILRNGNYSSLMVMEVNLQSGYVFTEENFQEVDYSLNKGIKSIQLDHNQDRFVVYFENEVCFKLKALREYNVVNAKPGWVIMYALEKKDSKTVKSFIIDDSYS
ncbi:uncharacterized protein LOC129917097 [Episyrphus balteatus]|uniref:uncharacterized protein LOC129917097 n=1 Tax=Episyrphus balteatus TaxID=286459 RepID=UPI002485312A|nr:uncharacterized protein LOC129917097 [Episyrphus balteatus]